MGPPFILWPLVWVFLSFALGTGLPLFFLTLGMGLFFYICPWVWAWIDFFALGMGVILCLPWYGPPFYSMAIGMGLSFICPWYGPPFIFFDPRYGSFLLSLPLVWALIDFFALGRGVGLCDQMFNVDPLPVPAGLGEKWSLESRLTSSVLDFNMPGQVRLGA